jgi:hypothetical protein
MLYREIIAVCSQIRTERINTVCGLKVEFVKHLLLAPKKMMQPQPF